MNNDEARAVIAAHQPDNLVQYLPLPPTDESRAKLRTLRRRRKQQAITLLGRRCFDCGIVEIDHLEIYEFDHVRGTKKTEISRMWTSSWKNLSKELKKCDLVCSNCHAKRTYHRRDNNGCE